MATTHGPYTFDAIADGDAAAFSWTDQVGTTSALQTNNTAGRWCWHNSNTTSADVGPDYGQGGTGDGYAYTEMSSQTSGDIWILEFDTDLDASAENWEVEYYWCLRGASCEATVQLQTNENGAGWVNRGSASGFGDETIPTTGGATTWWQKTVDLTGLVSHASTRVRWYIVSTANPTTEMWHNDFGFDSITITGTDAVAREQDSFRFEDDDGSESGSTFKAAQNTDITIGKETNFRPRVGGQMAGDAPTEAATLQYKETGDAATEWKDV